ncbi:MAG: ABC transporter ATP-binding protein [Lentisphaerae bacterium]|jgi:putative ABC transport system ATP-binding protein|nr:ABC transporter ATP-binding protein [Lentisphaerota bacterium]
MAASPFERLRLKGVGKSFAGPGGPVEVLRGVDLTLNAGEFGVITGPSGSGKTTLLMVAGLLQHPDCGEVWLDGREVSALGEGERTRLRKETVGMVFQQFGLLPQRSALDNVRFRFRYLDVPRRRAEELSRAALERVGLSHRAAHAARLLSAGEMQRVGIARALALPPRLLLADEPTGNLDSEAAAGIMELFRELNGEGMSILLVTHNREWAEGGGRHWVMREGRLQE